MISFNTPNGEFDDDRLSILRKDESARLSALQSEHLIWNRIQMLRRLPIRKDVFPEYADYLGDFSGDKDPFNFVLNAMYSEEV